MIELLDHRNPAVAEEIFALQQASYAVERDLIGYPDFPPLRVQPEQIRQERELFLGYRHEGELVGVISFTRAPHRLEIGRMVVAPAMFRRGIASALLRAVEEQVATGGTLTVSTAERNHPAVRLYEKHGYRVSEHTTLPDGLVLVRLSKQKDPG